MIPAKTPPRRLFRGIDAPFWKEYERPPSKVPFSGDLQIRAVSRYIQTVSPARALAYEILTAVESGAYASDLLAARSGPLDSRDAGLAAEIVLGVLRYRAQLDFLIEHYSGKPAGRLDAAVRQALRMGIYQLRFLERIPAHAAVSESVELIKRARKRSAAGFANAVLRKVDRAPVAWPSPAVELSHPGWLLERWERQYGAETAAVIARANLRVPGSYVNPQTARIQDIGSQSIVPLLALAPGQEFLDLCAAPGNKTAQALAAGVRATACDIHFRRLATLKSLGIDLVVLDGTRPLRPHSAQEVSRHGPRSRQVPHQPRQCIHRPQGRQRLSTPWLECAVENHKPVRIGVNWGSLDQSLLTNMMDENQEAGPSPAREVMFEAMIASALDRRTLRKISASATT